METTQNAELLDLRETERHQPCLSCARGGYVIMRHNEIQDVTATLLCEVTLYVEVEPTLQPVTGERMNRQSAKVDDNYQLHMKCRGFWSSSQDAF